jgi:hypothetical protein
VAGTGTGSLLDGDDRGRTHVIRARTRGIALLLATAAALAGCAGDDDGASTGTNDRAADDGPVKVREVTPPTTDEDLTKDLGTTADALTAAGCTFGTFEEQEPVHVDEGEALSEEEFPPTSGKHYDNWAPFGVYDEPVEDGFAVHNLEHGGVAVWLGTKVEDDVVEAIGALPEQDEKWLVAPRRDLKGLVSVAWAKGLACSPEALATFEDADAVADAIDEWYDVVNSTGSEAEKDVAAYAGAMKEPSPERDVSTESPF